MIRQLHNVTSQVANPKTHSLHRPAGSGEFQKMLGSAKSTAGSAGAAAATGQPARLGPFTDMGVTPVQPATIPDIELPVPGPVPNADLVSQPLDVHNAQQHEARMNTWLESYTDFTNKQKVELYKHAMTDWQANAAHCKEMGLPIPAEPAAPVLDPVQPMPAGWWFKNS